MDKKEEKRLHIRIDADLHRRTKEKASKEYRTLSNYVLSLIIKDLEKDSTK